MLNEFSRSELLIGREGVERLASCRVAVFGLGGVGGYAAEALARSGIGALDLVDGDVFSITNLNRQILATHSTLGRGKAEVAAQRVADINPACKVTEWNVFLLPENAAQFPFAEYDYIVDAVDTVAAKLALAVEAGKAGTPIISCMGTGNKTDPTMLEVGDIGVTSVCPLARVMRRELRARGVTRLKVVWSREPPAKSTAQEERTASDRPVPASMVFVPAAAGLLLAAEVVKDLLRRA